MNSSIPSLFNRRQALVVAGALAFAGVLAVGAQSHGSSIAIKRDAQPVTRGQLERASFSDVVKLVSPSVVKITTETKARKVALGENEMPGMDNPMLREFFGSRMPEMSGSPRPGSVRA